MKELKPMLYEIVCQECKDFYGFKLYNNNGITESVERPKYNGETTVLQSHGICKICLPVVYKKYGLDLEYMVIKK